MTTPNIGLIELGNSAGNYLLANETFAILDALVGKVVKDKDLNAPPGSPDNGDVYIIGPSPTGLWAGHANKIAFWNSNIPAWVIITPKEGWKFEAVDEDLEYRYNGSAWVVFSVGSGVVVEDEGSTVATATVLNFTGSGVTVTDAGGGQVDITISGGGGGAVSSVNGQTGDVLVPQPNLLINGDFAINQSGFAGGAVAAGNYGLDRWGAYNGGANYSVSGDTITLTSGTICQPIENPGLAGVQVTISVEDPSGTVAVTIGNGTGADSASGNITSGSGRRGVTLTVPATVTGHLKVRLAGTAVTFKRVKVERSATATPWLQPDRATELNRARRYFQALVNDSGGSAQIVSLAQGNSSIAVLPIIHSPALRATPTVTISNIRLTDSTLNFYSSDATLNATFTLPGATISKLILDNPVATVPNPTSVGINSTNPATGYIRFAAEITCTD